MYTEAAIITHNAESEKDSQVKCERSVWLRKVNIQYVDVSLTGQELDNGSEDKSLALLEPEELENEDKEADAA